MAEGSVANIVQKSSELCYLRPRRIKFSLNPLELDFSLDQANQTSGIMINANRVREPGMASGRIHKF